jgi:hypothetical protein
VVLQHEQLQHTATRRCWHTLEHNSLIQLNAWSHIIILFREASKRSHMKFAPRRRYNYIANGINTDADYVTSADICAHHGERFAAQFELFAAKLHKLHVHAEEKEIDAYYYTDYQHIARRTALFLDPAN